MEDKGKDSQYTTKEKDKAMLSITSGRHGGGGKDASSSDRRQLESWRKPHSDKRKLSVCRAEPGGSGNPHPLQAREAAESPCER